VGFPTPEPGPRNARPDRHGSGPGHRSPDNPGLGSLPRAVVPRAVLGDRRRGRRRRWVGRGRPVLDLEVTDGEWLGGDRSFSLRAPHRPTSPRSSLRVSTNRAAARREGFRPFGVPIGAAAGTLAALPSSASRWMRSLRPGDGDPRHGLGRRRIAPALVGLMALVLLAGSTSVPFGSRPAGHPAGERRGRPGHRQPVRGGADPSHDRSPCGHVDAGSAPPSLADSAPLALTRCLATPHTGRCPSRRASTCRT